MVLHQVISYYVYAWSFIKSSAVTHDTVIPATHPGIEKSNANGSTEKHNHKAYHSFMLILTKLLACYLMLSLANAVTNRSASRALTNTANDVMGALHSDCVPKIRRTYNDVG